MSELIKIDDLFTDVKTVSELLCKMQKLPTYLTQGDIKTTHKFNGGLYYRTFYPKKDSLIVGKIHKFAGFNILLKGSVTIYDGENTKTFKAPFTWEAPANSQKVGLFHEDSEFASVSTCFADNVEEAEKELFYSDETTIEQVNDWLHYRDMKHYLGMNEEQVQEYVQLDNMLEDSGLKDFELRDSNIHGVGFFTTKSYKKDDCLGKALVVGKRTELGRWVNDSCVPNTFSKAEDGENGSVFALRDIEKGEEITISYIDNLLKREELK